MPKKSVGKIFTVEVTSDIEKVSLGSGGGAISKIVLSRLSLENLLSQSADNFRRGRSFSVSLFLCTDKVKIRVGGNVKIFRRNFFVSQCRKHL